MAPVTLDAGSAMKTLAHLEAQLAAPSPALGAAALALLAQWPWASRDAAPVWTETVGLWLLSAPDASKPGKVAAPKGKVSAAVLAFRAQLLALASRLARALVEGPRAVDARAHQPPEALALGTQKAFHGAWLARAEARRSVDVPSLLAVWLEGPATQSCARAACFFDWPADVRIGAAAAAALARPIVARTAEHPLWFALAALAALHRTPEGDAALARFGDEVRGFRWAARLAATRPPAEAPPVVQAPRTRDTPRTLEEWEAWVLADCEDRGRREIFRDWLLEREDARGEFLALQLSALDRPLQPAERRREVALLKKHRKAWLGPLARFIRAETARFAGGLLVEATAWPAPGRVPAPDAAALRSLRALTLLFAGDVDGVTALLTGPSLARLTSLGGLYRGWLTPLLEAGHAHLEALGGELDIFAGGVEPLAAAAPARFPSLRRLRLQRMWSAGEPRLLPALPLCRQLSWFSTDAYASFAEWLAAADDWPTLETLEILAPHSPAWSTPQTRYWCHWHRDGLRWRFEAELRRDASGLAEELAALPKARLSTLRIDLAPEVHDAARRLRKHAEVRLLDQSVS